MQFTDSNVRKSAESYPYLDRFLTVDARDVMTTIRRRHQNTCSWLLDEQSVVDWLAGSTSNIFWLRGYPGLGKSVFARYLVETLSKADDQATDWALLTPFWSTSSARIAIVARRLSATLYRR
jgi:hypothetical protein